MSKFYVRGLERADFDRVLHVSPESTVWGLLTPQQLDEVVKHPSWIGFVDDAPVAAGGLVRLWPGLAEAWLTVTPLASQHVPFVLRHSKALLDVAVDAYHLRRIEAHVRADFFKAIKLAARLGFTPDAKLAKYGPNGESYYLFSRVI